MLKLYIDMDGVLADFDTHYETVFGVKLPRLEWRTPPFTADLVDWKRVRETGDFFLNIPPMNDLDELWDFIEPMNPTVLTGIPASVAEAADNKRAWVTKNLGAHVPMIACLSKEKCRYANPDAILIDDWEKYRHLWIERGGRWITHVSASATIAELRKLAERNP